MSSSPSSKEHLAFFFLNSSTSFIVSSIESHLSQAYGFSPIYPLDICSATANSPLVLLDSEQVPTYRYWTPISPILQLYVAPPLLHRSTNYYQLFSSFCVKHNFYSSIPSRQSVSQPDSTRSLWTCLTFFSFTEHYSPSNITKSTSSPFIRRNSSSSFSFYP